MIKTASAIIIASLSITSGTALAADPAAGQAKSTTCAACHGPNGISPNDLWPNLAGQKQAYLVKQLKAFRDGQRADPMMAPMASSLTDQDIEDLAAYYASLGG